ncbi:ComEC/Rec2 family competence protein [Corynebacterium breve]|uniref:ComEC/Rec2 family competence protein n=1 Tax=Corynebacterium breve TaxID=3049799 RepID=A0ABY8VFU7_9CORY|nr:ComEC/Rec2 family competence protein [Corynebacterium breve]WIM67143.1 ComEC/Rec2 family competence protein [Corynebacterium breve]
MSELRLVPAAAMTWLVTLCVLIGVPRVAVVGACVLGIVFAATRQWGQLILCSAFSAAAAFLASARVRAAQAFSLGDDLVATVVAKPKELASGTWLVKVRAGGYPAEIPVFAEELQSGVVPGARVVVAGGLRESDRPGVGWFTLNGDVSVVDPPRGFAAFAAHVRESLAISVEAHVPDHSQGLIPGMVLGDTSLQSHAEQDAYIATGLSHLSAVSGANVAIVATASVMIARAVGVGLRAQVVAAGVTVFVFAGLVGAEPSVLRATVTGLVGLVAVLASSNVQPMHALSLATIALVLFDSDMAVNYGFALSVAATVGIIALNPMLYRWLARTRWPDILVRALAVAIAADLMTMPIIALMTGEVSLVSVAANVLVAPATAPVTVLGLIAVLLTLLPGGLEQLLFFAIQPFTWWIHTIGHGLAALPNSTTSATPWLVLLGYGWVLAGFMYHRPRTTLLFVLAALILPMLSAPRAPEVDIGQLATYVVDKQENIEPIPTGTELIVVLDDEGRPAPRGTRTAGGIPVLFPHRDGEVRVHEDGSQHAADGRF